jgi:hypothetical protein
MISVFINEATAAGKQPVTHVAHSKIGVKRSDNPGIPLDEYGEPIGTPWEEVQERFTRKLSERFGIDFFKVTRLREAGLLKDKDVTNELLLSPEFKYEPYPGFKPTPPQKPVNRDPEWEAAVKEMFEAMENEEEDEFEDELETQYAAGKM